MEVLIVDDSADAAASLTMLLELEDIAVQSVGDAEAALEFVASSTPLLMLIDIGLPGMNGYDVARVLRATYPSLRLIALTGYGQVADAEAAGVAGFDAHCTKPVTIAELLEEIEPVIVNSDS